MTRNDHYTWTPAPAWMQGADLIADLSTDAEDVILAFTVDTYDAGEINPSFSVKIGDDWYDTMNTIDWPEVERRIPRDEWPLPMYAGVRGPKIRTPDKAIADAITAYKKQLSEQA
nr:MAG TPA: hypothetical protein [Caudoviricetes sp.]